VVAVPATGLVAHLEPVGQSLEGGQHLLEGPNLGAADDLSGLAEHADGDAGAVDVESDVKHGGLQVGVRRAHRQVPRYPADRGLLHSFTPAGVAFGAVQGCAIPGAAW